MAKPKAPESGKTTGDKFEPPIDRTMPRNADPKRGHRSEKEEDEDNVEDVDEIGDDEE
jgi:hypothetical protein